MMSDELPKGGLGEGDPDQRVERKVEVVEKVEVLLLDVRAVEEESSRKSASMTPVEGCRHRGRRGRWTRSSSEILTDNGTI